MKVLLLGATGRTGKFLLDEALRKQYSVHCLVRDASKITLQNSNLRIFEGNPVDGAQLMKAGEGCEAVISVLNISRTSDFPWAGLRTPKTLLSEVMKNLLGLSEQQDLKRIVVCSAWGVSETKKEVPGWFRWFIDHSNIGPAYEDHERQEALLMASELPWTIVRPSFLTNTKKPQTILESYDNLPQPRLTISRQTVAKYMVDALERDSLIQRVPVISAK